MANEIQLLSFIVSFLFGIGFALLNEINKKMIIKAKKHIKIIVTFLFVLTISMLYLFLMYKINEGVIHIYFLLFVIVGYMIGVFELKVLTKNVKHLTSFIEKFKKKKNT